MEQTIEKTMDQPTKQTVKKSNPFLINTIVILITLVLIITTRMIQVLPWWSFVVPVFLFGISTRFLKWEIPGFTLGFLAGFIVWFGFNWYIDNQNGSIVINRLAQMIGTGKLAVLLGAGAIGGILGGLSLSAGEQMFAEGKSKKLVI